MDNITLSTPHNKALYTSPSSSDHHQYHHYLMSSSQSPNLALNLNDDGDCSEEEEEAMFEKPLTPSDVGKLNRLVIPKQHAEKYFPLGGGSGDSAAEKGLLLSFEDEAGKTWRFRYSYWNSSQSYVLTKGWSRYVKEKRLDAGDVVLFKRHRADAERLFIGWRRRASAGPGQEGRLPGAYPAHRGHAGGGHYRNNGLGSGVAPYQPDCIHAGLVSPAQSQTTSLGNSNNSNVSSSKILRLFGVNMECPYHEHSSAEASAPDDAAIHAQARAHHYYHAANHFSESQYHDHMDFTFAGDVNPMRDRRS